MNENLLKNLINHMFLVSFILFPGMVFADKDPAADKSNEQEYITPDKLTREDRLMLNEYVQNYNNCLTRTSIEQMKTQTDPRYIVDFAMKQCATELETLNTKMIDRNFEPNFRDSFLHRISTNSANQTLQAVMYNIANRPSQPETTDTAQ